jgi:beta-phosphoglucomutase-like phosphatase (HAD superfamily)
MRAALDADLGRPLPDDHETRCGAELFALFRCELKSVRGISQVVSVLRSTDYPRCVASSSSPERIALALDLAGLRDDFGPNVFSSTQVRRGKPAPDLFLYAADAMGFPPSRCIVVEDSVNGVKAAMSAGMPALGFLGGSHCPPNHGEHLTRAGANRICRDASELMHSLCEIAGVRRPSG